MSRTKQQRMAARNRANQSSSPSQTPTADSYQNLQARLGVGSAADNLSAGASYELNPKTRQRFQLEAMYRGSWIVGIAVDAPADDMVAAGVDLIAGVKPNEAEDIQAAFDDLNIWSELADVIRWGRLYGGAISIILIEGQDLSTPLRFDTIQKDQFRGLATMDRWQLQPTLGELVEELGPYFGKPKFYTVVADDSIRDGFRSPLLGRKIHYTRVIRFEGDRLPFYQRVAEMGWGMSVLERLYDRLVAFDSTTQGAAQLVFKAHLRTLKVKGLTQILAGPDAALQALVKRVEQVRRFQTTEGMSLIDADDDIEHYNYSFGGLDGMMLQFAQQISGALQVPLVRLLGQSPAGLSSTGESDLRTYYDGIKRRQEKHLKFPLKFLFEIMHRSVLGREIEPGFDFSFNPLWQMSDKEKADIATATTGAVLAAHESALISAATALKELRKSSLITGVFSNISDEDIATADQEPPEPMPEVPMLGEEIPGEESGEFPQENPADPEPKNDDDAALPVAAE